MNTPRIHLSLDGEWSLVLDPENRGVEERWFENPPQSDTLHVRVPSVWDRWVPGYDGVGWYFRDFDADPAWKECHAELRFDAADYYAEVWLNGIRLGDHEGGYTPFALTATAPLRGGSNSLAVRIVDPHGKNGFGDFGYQEFPCAKESSYWSFGGIWGGVSLAVLPKLHIEDVFIQPDIRRKRIAVHVACSEPATVRLAIAGTPYSVEGPSGALTLEFPEFALWFPESPHLYTLECALLQNGIVTDRHAVRFGMREFTVKDNRFFLNNRPYFVRGVLLQPDYPRALAAPEPEDLARREIELAKEAGFNLIRAHLRPPPPITLDLCDELGMLVYEEPAIGWLKNSRHLQRRCENEVREMILRDRNHPCVVIWGMLNESGSADYASGAGAQTVKDALCRLARSLDPGRIVIDDSGGTNYTGEPARIMRPYRDELEPFDDLHGYQRAPVDHDIESYFRHNGAPDRLCFLSEFGFGGPEDLEKSLAAYGTDADTLKDARFIRGMIEAARRGFAERGLDRIFGDFAGFLAAARELQADAVRFQVDAIRANPKYSGYCYTQLADAGHEFCAGLLDRWRRPKPALGAFKTAQKPLRCLIQMRSTNLVPREEAPVTVLLANEERIEGRADLSLQVVGPTNQVLWKKMRQVKLPKPGRELWSGAIAASGSTGTHRFVVRVLMERRIVAESAIEFYVIEPAKPSAARVHVLDPRGEWQPQIAKLATPETLLAPVHVIPPLANTIRAYPDNELAQIMAQVRGGAVAIFFAPPPDWNDFAAHIDPAITATPKDAVGGFMMMAHYAKLHPVFDGLPTRCLMRQPYKNLVPPRTFLEASDEDISGTFDTGPIAAGNYLLEETSWWGSDILVRRLGSGRIVFTHLRVLENLGDDPAADRVLVNLINHFARRSVPPDAVIPLDQKAVEWLRQERVQGTRRWMTVGEFPNWENGKGHHTAYPPEEAIDFAKTYPGWYRVVSWRPWFSRADDKHIVDLQAAFSPVYQYFPRSDHATGYAYAEFSCDRRAEVALSLGVQNAMKVWLNGRIVFENERQFPHDRLEAVEAAAPVKQGRNTLLVKCSKIPGPFRFALDIVPAGREHLQINWWK